MKVSESGGKKILSLVHAAYLDWQGLQDPLFVKDEITYKREACRKAQELLGQEEFRRLMEGGEFAEIRSRLKKLARETNLLNLQYPSKSDILVLIRDDLDFPSFVPALYDLLYGEGASPERLTRYLEFVTSGGYPNRWPFPTYFLFLFHPETDFFIKPEVTKDFLKIVGEPLQYAQDPDAAWYGKFLELLTDIRDALRVEGVNCTDMVDLQSLIWVAVQESQRGFWKIAPGKGACHWDEWQEKGIVAVGWDEMGDLSKIKNRAEFDKVIEGCKKEQGLKDSDISSSQLWTFLRQIRPGDRLVANHGKSKVLGIGIVTGKYRYDSTSSFAHVMDVVWDDVEPREVSEPGWVKTIVKLDREKFETIEALPSIPPEHSFEAISTATGFPVKTLERWKRSILRKQQAVFYGPPGTGKTFIADHLARHLIGGGKGFSQVVQFHPSYAYEDFIEGIRPSVNGSECLVYKKERGVFLEFCRKAAEAKGDPCVMIVDEINRAPLSRVFGELMYLLEYRDKKIRLASGREFRIPENVYLIGTMNTADRSIALVDHALRRRFAFISLFPEYGVLESFHAENGFDASGLVGLLKDVNHEIGDRNYSVGVSFFLDKGIEENIEDIWRMEIEPYLEEYFYDQNGKMEDFRWEKVKARVLGGAE